MIRTIIIEDEKPAVRRLEKLLGLFSDLELVASLNSVEEAVDWFQENEHPQLIFSDIVLATLISNTSDIVYSPFGRRISAVYTLLSLLI